MKCCGSFKSTGPEQTMMRTHACCQAKNNRNCNDGCVHSTRNLELELFDKKKKNPGFVKPFLTKRVDATLEDVSVAETIF